MCWAAFAHRVSRVRHGDKTKTKAQADGVGDTDRLAHYLFAACTFARNKKTKHYLRRQCIRGKDFGRALTLVERVDARRTEMLFFLRRAIAQGEEEAPKTERNKRNERRTLCLLPLGLRFPGTESLTASDI